MEPEEDEEKLPQSILEVLRGFQIFLLLQLLFEVCDELVKHVRSGLEEDGGLAFGKMVVEGAYADLGLIGDLVDI